MSELFDTFTFVRLELPLVWLSFVFVFGACVGSFLNVVIFRIPAGRSVVRPRSHCACGVPIAWYDNVPLLSWMALRARARCCGGSVSVRYPLVEALTGVLFVFLWMRFEPVLALVYCFYVSGLIAAAFIDWDTMEIPDRFSIGGCLIGVGLSFAVPSMHGAGGSGFFMVGALQSGFLSLQGAFIGSGLILWIALVAELVLRKEAMGFGDVKLMGAIGAFCGWQGAVFSLFGGAVVGTAFVGVYALGRVIRGQPVRMTDERGGESSPDQGTSLDSEEDEGWQIPFGPALAAGSVLYLLIFEPIFDDYLLEIQELLQLLAYP